MAKAKLAVPDFMDTWAEVHAINSVYDGLLVHGCQGDAATSLRIMEHLGGSDGVAWVKAVGVCDCELVQLLAADVREKRVLAARLRGGCHWISEDEAEDGSWRPGTKALAN